MAPASIVCGLRVDAASFTNERFPSDFRYQFHTEDRVYYKTELAARLDEVAVSLCSRAQKYGDIHASITDLQNNVLQQVAQRVASLRAVLFDVSSVLAEIDVLLGWSEVCSECGYVRPSILHDFSIHIIVGFAPPSRAERTPSPPGARRRPLHPQRFPRFHFFGGE